MESPITKYTLSSGACGVQGKRYTMEDTHVHFDDAKDKFPDNQNLNAFSNVSFYGVYDGHGGKTTADLVEELLHHKIFNTPQFSQRDVQGSLLSGFQEVDAIVLEKAREGCWMNGATAVVAIITDSCLHVGNVGDSEACLVSVVDGGISEVKNLTTPHKANNVSEKKRIEDLGGHVFFGRVFGALAVSRAFGDSKYKQPTTSQNFVIAEPALLEVPLSQEHKYLIMACDGLWDVCTHDEAAKITHDLFKEGKSSEEVANSLVKHALDNKTDDNVTVVVVNIAWDTSA